MCKFNKKNGLKRIDPCIRELIKYLNYKGIQTLACCCGHKKYPMSIVVRFGNFAYEIVSAKYIMRKSRFYKKDKKGYYYIPEVKNG